MIESFAMTEEEHQKAFLEAEIELAILSMKYGMPLTTMEQQVLLDFDIPEL